MSAKKPGNVPRFWLTRFRDLLTLLPFWWQFFLLFERHTLKPTNSCPVIYSRPIYWFFFSYRFLRPNPHLTTNSKMICIPSSFRTPTPSLNFFRPYIETHQVRPQSFSFFCSRPFHSGMKCFWKSCFVSRRLSYNVVVLDRLTPVIPPTGVDGYAFGWCFTHTAVVSIVGHTFVAFRSFGLIAMMVGNLAIKLRVHIIFDYLWNCFQHVR